MNWILWVALLTTNGVSTNSTVFHDQTSCEKALRQIKAKNANQIYREAYCFADNVDNQMEAETHSKDVAEPLDEKDSHY